MRNQKISSPAAGAMENEHGVSDAAAGVASGSAERAVVKVQFGEGFAGFEMEIVRDEIAFERLVSLRCGSSDWSGLRDGRWGLLRARYRRDQHEQR